MKQARITYRFDRDGNRDDGRRRQERQGMPEGTDADPAARLPKEEWDTPEPTAENQTEEHDRDRTYASRNKEDREEYRQPGDRRRTGHHVEARWISFEPDRYEEGSDRTPRDYDRGSEGDERIHADDQWYRREEDRPDRGFNREPGGERQARQAYPRSQTDQAPPYERAYAPFGTGKDEPPAEGNRGRTERGKVVTLFDDEFHVVPEDTKRMHFARGERSWTSPHEEDTKRIERLIRHAERERNEEWDDGRGRPLRSGRSADTRLDNGYPTEPEPREYAVKRPETERYRDSYGRETDDEELPYLSARSVRRAGMPWLKVTASLTAAVAVGGLLGYFVLGMFSNGEGTAEQTGAGRTAVVDDASGSGKGTGKDSVPALAGVTASIPAKTFTLLQNGKFSSEQGAETAAGALDSLGYAAATEQGEFYVVYAGIADNMDNAKLLANRLKEKKIEIYPKEVTLPALNRVKWNGDPEKLRSFLTETNRLVQMMAGLTLVHLEETSPTPLDANNLESLKKAHQAWTQAAAGSMSGAGEDAKAELQKMQNAVNTAFKSLESYGGKPSSSYLWQAQTNLMLCILAEKELLEAIKS